MKKFVVILLLVLLAFGAFLTWQGTRPADAPRPVPAPEPEHPGYFRNPGAGAQKVYVCRSRARLMRVLSQSLMEAGADCADGVRLENDAGRVHITPAPDSEAVVIDAQAADPSKSAELAEGFLGLVKGLEEKG